MWIRSLCGGQDAKAAGVKGSSVGGSPEQIAYWRETQPIVTALIRNATVRVACDPERVEHLPGKPAVILAWCAVDSECVYGAGIKRELIDGFGRDLTRDLLRDELGRTMRTALDMGDIGRINMIPREAWQRERRWASSLRQLSRCADALQVIDKTLRRDVLAAMRDSALGTMGNLGEMGAMYTRVAEHILDPARKRWEPNERRAA